MSGRGSVGPPIGGIERRCLRAPLPACPIDRAGGVTVASRPWRRGQLWRHREATYGADVTHAGYLSRSESRTGRHLPIRQNWDGRSHCPVDVRRGRQPVEDVRVQANDVLAAQLLGRGLAELDGRQGLPRIDAIEQAAVVKQESRTSRASARSGTGHNPGREFHLGNAAAPVPRIEIQNLGPLSVAPPRTFRSGRRRGPRWRLPISRMASSMWEARPRRFAASLE